jgi:hypothetical protein
VRAIGRARRHAAPCDLGGSVRQRQGDSRGPRRARRGRVRPNEPTGGGRRRRRGGRARRNVPHPRAPRGAAELTTADTGPPVERPAAAAAAARVGLTRGGRHRCCRRVGVQIEYEFNYFSIICTILK